MMRRSLALCVGLALLTGCEKSADEPAVELVVEPASTEHYLLDNQPLRFAPTLAERVADPAYDRDMPNVKSNFFRGQKVMVEKRDGEWVYVRCKGDAVGWMLERLLLSTENLEERVVSATTEGLDAAAGKVIEGLEPIERGSLVLVSASTDGYALANVGAGQPVWLAESSLSADAKEVAMAHIIVQAEWTTKHGLAVDNARRLDKARIKYPNSGLMDLVADQVNFEDVSETPVLGTLDRAEEALQLKSRK